ncbi:hypothetical protein BH10ACI3_BH10ACI3_16910 [soil metagenome]
MKVKEIMSAPVITISDDETVLAAATIMLRRGIGCVPVVNDLGAVIGLVTKSDFVAREESLPFSTVYAPQLLGHWLKAGVETIYEIARTVPVKQIMRKDPTCLTEDDSVRTFLEKIIRDGITHAPVLRDNVLIGIIAQHDLLKMVVHTSGLD